MKYFKSGFNRKILKEEFYRFQIHSIIYVAIVGLLARPLQEANKNIQVCTVEDESDTTTIPQDGTISILVSLIYSIFSFCANCFFQSLTLFS